MKIHGIQYLACLWTLFITQTGFVCSDMQFLERHEGESVVLSCVIDKRNPSPFGVYLMRNWLKTSEVLFMHTESDVSADKRISVSGDPSSHSLNVTISQLRASDTDRYYCEFVADNPLDEDDRTRGKTEFFLLVNADALGPVDIGLVETCAGGSAVLPCLPPHGEALAVEGVSLKRQRGRAPVEVLYHSKRHHGDSPPSSSLFPFERVHLSSAPGPRGITYNLTLQQLQPDDSALYSCELLLRGRPETGTTLGRLTLFVSVQGGQCGCSNYSTLLYALSAVVVFLLLLLILGFVVIQKGKARRSVKSHPPAPIYEEMTGVPPVSRKLPPRHLEETESSEYRNCSVKRSCTENHYESPIGALIPKSEP
ncbi:cd7 antigen-like isoform X1 [Etheostoma cragini]|uniref:cd7 antigen-like isoform X1 n=1 Tax=Etheostoma cragini TaxID=417921 RepID=UPI00155E08CE|nr:cd7 antigen-like isoform X1 [Etheostoma cragini]